jgi:hypothetical protein
MSNTPGGIYVVLGKPTGVMYEPISAVSIRSKVFAVCDWGRPDGVVKTTLYPVRGSFVD